ncbi:MAG: biotin/lipoyl-containing protein [Planctomycetota bacterium]
MKYFAKVRDRDFEFRFERRGGKLLAHSDGSTWELDLSNIGDGSSFSLLVDGRSHDVLVEPSDGGVVVQTRGERLKVQIEDERERAAHAVVRHKPTGRRTITAVMPGIVVDVLVAVGDQVEDGQTLVVLEAMKMQNPVTADGKARVSALHAKKGAAVASGAVLIELE